MLYCRKKLGANLPVVRKSCAVCRKAKVKCNSEFPRCCRCVDKGLDCVYELTRRSEVLALQPASSLLNEPRSTDAIFLETSKAEGQDVILLDNPPSCNNNASLNLNADQLKSLTDAPELLCQNNIFEWSLDAGDIEELENSDVGVNSIINGASNEFLLDFFSLGHLPGLIFESAVSVPADCMFQTPYLVLRHVDFDYPAQFTSLLTPRSPFIPSHLSSGSQIGRTFLLQNIQSYATLLASSRLPPFIHPVSLPSQGPALHSSAPLEICKSIISLYASKTAATSPFIWRSIAIEKERFMEELECADEWTTLSMLQALTLYILLRIFDQGSFSVDFDHELVHAMLVRYHN